MTGPPLAAYEYDPEPNAPIVHTRADLRAAIADLPDDWTIENAFECHIGYVVLRATDRKAIGLY